MLPRPVLSMLRDLRGGLLHACGIFHVRDGIWLCTRTRICKAHCPDTSGMNFLG